MRGAVLNLGFDRARQESYAYDLNGSMALGARIRSTKVAVHSSGPRVEVRIIHRRDGAVLVTIHGTEGQMDHDERSTIGICARVHQATLTALAPDSDVPS